MKLLQSFCFALLTVFFVSCGDDGGPSISLTSPSDGDSFTAGQTITIAGTATDDVAIASVIVQVPELTIDQTLPANNTPTQSFTFTIDLVQGTPALEDVTVRIVALDDEGNRAEEERSISIQ